MTLVKKTKVITLGDVAITLISEEIRFDVIRVCIIVVEVTIKYIDKFV